MAEGRESAAQVEWRLEGEAATRALGAALAAHLAPGAVVALYGRVGAGKTTFVAGLASGLGAEAVQSPTFALAGEYGGGRLPLYHLDLYRLGERALQELDMLDEYLYGDGACALEWADYLGPALPAERLDVMLRDAGGNGEARTAAVSAHGRGAAAVLEEWMRACPFWRWIPPRPN